MGRSRTLLAGWAAAMLAIAAFAALGSWQLSRLHQKQAMLDAVRGTLQARHALPLSAALSPQRGDAYDWAEGQGRFASGPTVLLDNQSRQNRAGVRAYRMFHADDGTHLLVELGWLPLPGDRTMPQALAPTERQRIRGLLMPPPSHGLAAPVAQQQANGTIVATALDASDVVKLLGEPRLGLRLLRLDPALAYGYERDLDVLPNTLPPERHLGYAVQWFALAAAVLATALILTFRRPRRTAA